MTADAELAPRRPTLADVARAAGVSVATASKALNGRRQVREETRQRVVHAAEELAFRPNVLARQLQKGRSGTIGLVTHDLEGRFSIPTLMGAEDEAGNGEVSVLLCDARGDTLRERYHVQALLGRRVDGLIIVGARPDVRPSLGRLPVPVVYAYAPSEDPDDMSQVCDSVEAGALVAEHLVARGRRRIAVVAGDESYGAARDRVEGATRALARAGLEPAGGRALFGSWDEAWGRTAVETILGLLPDVDAVICGSDQIARGALDTLREHGRRVPEDVAVTGHDNWEVIVAHSRPRLTSVDMNLEELGRRAAARLFAAIEGHPSRGIESVSPRLVARDSTRGFYTLAD
ncbi:LacI family DNA-binding transcriptional regulator [Georgenia faecalis]|uniref:LacI family DNA-binding transcriptional regulator n=1 Tax=Georgenia faecalis TaxID=2483799 RepID=UPI000FD96FC6|nr:LacI family DNA-binding transcriptional regulator [Georgenia faecalis]